MQKRPSLYVHQQVVQCPLQTQSLTRHTASTIRHSLTFRVRRYVVIATKTRAPITNPRNSAQLEGTPYHSPKLHPGPCSSMGMRRGTDRQRDTQTTVTNNAFRLGYASREM